MAHIPMDDITQLWSETSNHSWQALKKTVVAHKGEAQGISDNLVTLMDSEISRLEHSGVPYPDSANKLYQVLNQHLELG